MPRPRAARPGSVVYIARPRRELTWVRPHSHASSRGEGGRPRRTPAGPSPPPSARWALGGSDGRTAGPGRVT